MCVFHEMIQKITFQPLSSREISTLNQRGSRE